MKRKNEWQDEYIDPIRAAREKQAHQKYVDDLFHPFHRGDELMEIRWLVEGFLPQGYLVMLAGSPKAGKTCFATALGLAVANGIPFAGLNTRHGGVLWIAAEENRYERRLLVGESPLAEPSAPFYTCYEHLKVDEDETMEILMEWIKKTDAALIVVDPLLASISGRSLVDSWSARRSLMPLKRLCDLTGVCAIVLHHPKRDYIRGKVAVADNAQLAATASMSIVLSSSPALPPPPYPRNEDEEGVGGGVSQLESSTSSTSSTSRIIRLSCEGRGAWANKTKLFYSEGPLEYRSLDAVESLLLPEKVLTFSEREVIKVLVDGKPRDSHFIIEKSGIPENTARNVITSLRRKGVITHVPGSKLPRKYVVCPKEKNVSGIWDFIPKGYPKHLIPPGEEAA